MAKRMRRCTLTVDGSGLSGARNLTWDPDQVQTNWARGDDEAVGDGVIMQEGPIRAQLEVLAPDTTNLPDLVGYFSSIVATGKVIEMSGGAESEQTHTVTFSDGIIRVGGNYPIENEGAMPVTIEAKTIAQTLA